MTMSNFPSNQSTPSITAPDIQMGKDLKDYIPQFNQQSELHVWLANGRYDAPCYRYRQPRVQLGQTSFLIDFGDRIGLVASTWQGSMNSGSRYQDLLFLLEMANKRTRNEQDFNHPQRGLWSKDWLIGGTETPLVTQLTKMRHDFIKKSK